MLDTLSEELKQSRSFELELREFAEIVTKDAELQKKFTEAVDGGISRDGFRNLYVASAAEHSIHFTPEQMEIAMHEQKQGKDKVLPSLVQKLVTVL